MVIMVEQLLCEQDIWNIVDRYAVAVKKTLGSLLPTFLRKFPVSAACLFSKAKR